MSQPSSNIAPAVSSVPWATPETSSMDAPGDRFGYAPGRLRVPSAGLSGPTFPGTQYVDVAAIFADGGYNSPKPIGNPLAKAALWVSVFAIFAPRVPSPRRPPSSPRGRAHRPPRPRRCA